MSADQHARTARKHRARWKRGGAYDEFSPEQNPTHVLIEPDEDRWEWRRRIRRDPRKLAFYRVGVGVAGLFFIVLGAITGPLPGPGGIPLVLTGLAIWSSEFTWAHRLMRWFKSLLRRFRRWPMRQRVLLIVLLICAGLLIGYGALVTFGVPAWTPRAVADLLERLPGV
ncbi:MAG TPA: PGPGW domain-containing protein [Microlunatus sp.]|nr:PGPGW domain-containing protein [Microlunatus sp.]